ncbi:MAG TPA: YndJ family transporter [Terriglobales bacterium]|nr:YndJ family transporter [Terriglobales bacterium]
MRAQTIVKWEQGSVLFGTLIWAVLAALAGARKAPLGVIELLFLFAPLVIVPLGIALGRMVSPLKYPKVELWLGMVQPIFAFLTVVSFWLPIGKTAAILAIPWLVFCISIAISAALTLLRGANWSLVDWVVNIGRIDLTVAGCWLVMSRLGMRPLGIQEPIGLLTAVHFHYTGFATAMLLAALLTYIHRTNKLVKLFDLVALVVGTPFLVAAGFVYSPTLKMAAAIVLSIAVTVLAAVQFWMAKTLSRGFSRIYLRCSSLSVAAAMALASIYAVGDWLKQDWLVIPRMASTHGLLNALGFTLLGLLGWLVEFSNRSHHTSSVEILPSM